MTAPLAGLRVVDLSNTITGTQMSQLLTDFGAHTVHIEPPGGSRLRGEVAWPFWGRGKKSIVLDLTHNGDARTARSLIGDADVVIETWRPGVAERLGLGYADLAEDNPRLVYASVTGFGRDTPLSHLKGYEPIVMAKIGGLDAFSFLSARPGPSFVSTPYCSWSAGQLGLHGILAALYERETSGLGQRVETSLVQGILAHDCWNWLIRLLTRQYPGAFSSAPVANHQDLVPNSHLYFRNMVGLCADGRWMQFAQASDRLWLACLKALGLEWTLQDPVLKHGTTSDDPVVRVEFWETCLRAIRTKTYDEWLEVFERDPYVWADTYRSGAGLLRHPQLVHDHGTLQIDDPELGSVLQPGPLVRMAATPAEISAPAPGLDQHGPELRSTARGARGHRGASPAFRTDPPLQGVTVVELGSYYAGPFGATILAELGARVIKVEPLAGDPIRAIMPFPEVGGIKVLQGKESVAIDFTTKEGHEIVLELVRRAEVVLQTFRGGVAERYGYTAADLLAVNPGVVYLSAPGYGTDGPCGGRPAFAPVIGAASGLGYRNVGGPDNVPEDSNLTLDEVKRYSMRLAMASMSVANADGFSALGVGTALLLGILGRARGAPGQTMATSMLSTMANALSEDMVEYGRMPARPGADAELLGQGPRYRLYETADGWVFLAAPTQADWGVLADVLALSPELAEDPEALARRLTEIFATKTAAQWEVELTDADIACVKVVAGPVDKVMDAGGLGDELGIVAEMTHPAIGSYPRLGPLARCSRSQSVLGPAPLCGQQTDAVLAELGYDQTRIAALRAAGVIG